MLFSLLNYLVKHACLSKAPLIFVFLSILPIQILGQPPIEVTEELMREIFPDADEFSPKDGDPPVYRALH